MLNRFIWLIKYSFFLKRTLQLRCHWSAYADGKSRLEGRNILAKDVEVLRSTLGKFSYLNYGTVVSNCNIGRFSCVGPNVIIGGLGRHPTSRRSTHRMFYSTAKDIWADYCYAENYIESEPVEIGSDVWIGACSIILDGVRIGDGAIIAAGSVVTKNVDPYTIVGGVPAKLLRRRFSLEVEKKLINEAWWDLSDEDLKRAVQSGEFSTDMER